MSVTLRIAVWSGPRNISTALMRSWGNRPDTAVCDEPLYAYYLHRTGAAHPGAEEIIARGETDWRKVAESLTGPIPEGKSIYYQKHMAHHLLPEIDRGWLDRLAHCFLIRDPREMLASLAEVLPEPRIEDTGLPQQLEIFEMVRKRTGRTPPVIDARELLDDPRALLDRLCAAVGIPFQECMLSWPPGKRPTDGVWAPHWYASVEASTGFRPYRPSEKRLPERLEGLLAECREPHERLHAVRLRA